MKYISDDGKEWPTKDDAEYQNRLLQIASELERTQSKIHMRITDPQAETLLRYMLDAVRTIQAIDKEDNVDVQLAIVDTFLGHAHALAREINELSE